MCKRRLNGTKVRIFYVKILYIAIQNTSYFTFHTPTCFSHTYGVIIYL